MPDKPAIGTEDDWFQHAEYDLQSAKLLFQERGHSNIVAFLIQQAVEKYLKGYLISQGWKLKKTHDLESLITEATKYNQSLSHFLDFARTATDFYIQERYPPGPPIEYPGEEIALYLKRAEDLVARIKGNN